MARRTEEAYVRPRLRLTPSAEAFVDRGSLDADDDRAAVRAEGGLGGLEELRDEVAHLLKSQGLSRLDGGFAGHRREQPFAAVLGPGLPRFLEKPEEDVFGFLRPEEIGIFPECVGAAAHGLDPEAQLFEKGRVLFEADGRRRRELDEG